MAIDRPEMLGPYVVLEELGRGGMGRVFKARHRLLGRLAAVKVMHPWLAAESDAVARFRREIEAAARLRHPNVALVYDAGEHAGALYFAMEYAPGRDLDRLLAEHGPLTAAAACDCARQAALGLQHAHDHGLIHRDVKPSNLMVGKAGLVKVLDLGVALLPPPDAGGADAAPLTRPGALMGTADYMAPEQADDPHQVDARADVYSLGCTLYHLLAGRPPFLGGSLVEKLYRHQRETPAPVDRLRPDLPSGLAEVVAGMLAKNPADRYQTPLAAAQALEEWCEPPVVELCSQEAP
jgi:serine/threonine protein kinase